MKNIVFSIVEKKLFRSIGILVLVQVLLILVFLRLFSGGQPIKMHDTEQADIVVEEIRYIDLRRGSWLVIVADSEKYVFESSLNTVSAHELYQALAKGDALSVRSYKGFNLLGSVNHIVDMRADAETYLTLEEYNRAKRGLPTVIVIVFVVMELLFIGVVFVYGWLNHNVIKDVCKKIKKRQRNKK